MRLNDEHWKDNLIGQTLDDRLKQMIIDRQTKETVDTLNHLHESVFVAVTNPKTEKIKDIAFNEPDDLMLDNFGRFFAGFFAPRMGTNIYQTIYMTDVTGVSRGYTISAYTYNGGNSYNNGSGYRLAYVATKLGSGTNSPARTDYNIQTPLGGAPENDYINTAGGTWGGGKMAFASAVVALGSGSINESGVFIYARWSSGSNIAWNMWFHDKLSTSVGYLSGDKIATIYSVAM